jgi:hypothetical protein
MWEDIGLVMKKKSVITISRPVIGPHPAIKMHPTKKENTDVVAQVEDACNLV